MNNPRRKEIRAIIAQLEEIKDEIDSLTTDLEGLKEEEDEYRDNMPENMQAGERYEKACTACDNLESALEWLTSISGDLESAICSAEDACD